MASRRCSLGRQTATLVIGESKAPFPELLARDAVLLDEVSDHLRLLAKLTDTGTAASDYDNLFRPDSLAWWFSRLARDLEAVVDAAYWSEPAAAAEAAGASGQREAPRLRERAT